MGRQIAGPACNPSHQTATAGGHGDPCADRVAVAERSLEVEANPGVLLSDVIPQEYGDAIETGEGDIYIAIVDEVTCGEPATKVGGIEGLPGAVVHVLESPIGHVAQQKRGLLVAHICSSSFDRLIYVPVDEDQVEIAIVVEVQEL